MMSLDIRKISDGYQEYLRDESRSIGNADTISFPKSHKEVVNIVKNMSNQNIPITIQGSRTGLAAGSVPYGGHVINLSKMDRVLSMRKDENDVFFLNVQSGLVLSQLKDNIKNKKFNISEWDEESIKAYQTFLQSHEMFFSPDPTETSASIGGMVACNASGARSYLYGPTRKYIEKLKIVLSNGESLSLKRNQVFSKGRILELITESGNKLFIQLPDYIMPKTKNASGFYIEDNMDAVDLFIGSDGSLGIVTEVEIRLLKLPKIIWGVTCFLSDSENVVAYVDSIRRDLKLISSVEYFDESALNILRDQKNNNPAFKRLPRINDKAKTAIYLEIHANDEEDAMKELFKIQGLIVKINEDPSSTWVARNDFDKDKLYFFRHAIPESVNMLIDQRKKTYPLITKLGTDMSVPDDELRTVMDMYTSMLKENNLQSAIWGHIGDNHLHVNILPNNEEEYLLGKKLYEQWAREVTKLGGAVSAEHGIGKIKAEMLRIMYGDHNINQMKKLKLQLDKQGLLGIDNLFSMREV